MTKNVKVTNHMRFSGCVQHKHQITLHKCALVETSKHHGRCTHNSTLAIYAKFEFKYWNYGFFGGVNSRDETCARDMKQ